jgi:hypothetical protein
MGSVNAVLTPLRGWAGISVRGSVGIMITVTRTTWWHHGRPSRSAPRRARRSLAPTSQPLGPDGPQYIPIAPIHQSTRATHSGTPRRRLARCPHWGRPNFRWGDRDRAVVGTPDSPRALCMQMAARTSSRMLKAALTTLPARAQSVSVRRSLLPLDVVTLLASMSFPCSSLALVGRSPLPSPRSARSSERSSGRRSPRDWELPSAPSAQRPCWFRFVCPLPARWSVSRRRLLSDRSLPGERSVCERRPHPLAVPIVGPPRIFLRL